MSKYTKIAILATGGAGNIYEVIEQKTQKAYVMKTSRSDRKIYREAFQRECSMLQKFNGYSHIIPLIEVINENGCKAIILPRMKRTLMDEILSQPGSKLNEKDTAIMFKQICEGVKHLHDQQYAHLDIKPENILVDEKGECYLCDLGSVSSVYSGNEMTTTLYAAPEVHQAVYCRNPLPADMWSLGIVLCNMLLGEQPGNIYDEFSLMQFISEVQSQISILAADLLEGLLAIHSKNRLTINQVLNHPWFIFHAKKAQQKCV